MVKSRQVRPVSSLISASPVTTPALPETAFAQGIGPPSLRARSAEDTALRTVAASEVLSLFWPGTALVFTALSTFMSEAKSSPLPMQPASGRAQSASTGNRDRIVHNVIVSRRDFAMTSTPACLNGPDSRQWIQI